jgi:uncharacterized protein YlaN (UPF0358 family)
VAEFILNRGGAEHLKARVVEAIGQPIEFERAVPEYETRFDRFGRGRMHDLAIFGKTASGKSLFIGVEAKVDEPFGATVRDAYLTAKAKELRGEPTNAPERIEKIVKLHFPKPDLSSFEVRYQLLYATAGTIAAGAEVSVLFVVVFKTPLYSEVLSAQNYRDYLDFLVRVGAKLIDSSSDPLLGHKLILEGKELICLYETYELES